MAWHTHPVRQVLQVVAGVGWGPERGRGYAADEAEIDDVVGKGKAVAERFEDIRFGRFDVRYRTWMSII